MSNRFSSEFCHLIGSIPHGCFLLILIFSPWAYGCTRGWTLAALDGLLAVLLIAWGARSVSAGERISPGLLAVALSIAILGCGWIATLLGFLAEQAWLARYTDTPIAEFVVEFGSVAPTISARDMVHTSLMLAGMLVAIDILRTPRWVVRVFMTVAFTGFSIGVLGILQRVLDGPFRLASEDDRAWLAFATFRYWGNAGSFLNLVWPAAVALAVDALRCQRHPWTASGWILVASGCTIAVFTNQSKAATLLASTGMAATGLLLLTAWLRKRNRHGRPIAYSRLLIAAVPLAIILASIIALIPWQRWRQVLESPASDFGGRLPAYQKYAERLADIGWLGNGPGTFSETHAMYFSDHADFSRYGFWVAHQDYLETLIEWGWFGFALWALLIGIGGAGLVRLAMRTDLPQPLPLLAAAGFTAVVLTLLHAIVDFPMQIGSIQLYFIVWIAYGWTAWGRGASISGIRACPTCAAA